jgi:alcohol dehydrogenase
MMKAARLYQPGNSLQVETIPEPVLQPGGAIVRILSSHLPAFTQKVISGELGYSLPELPFTPGTSAIGVVEAVADDVFGIEVGQTVFCDPLMT